MDVAIVGAGPAGSAVATHLAGAGHRVVVLERETFPRFHIGESLLPMALPELERLGVDLAAGDHQFKAGATFRDEVTGQVQNYPFCDGLEGHPRHAYQVDRAVFDVELLSRARDAGAEVREGEAVRGLEISAGGVRLETSGGEVRARYLVDASGQFAFLARHHRSLRRLGDFGRAAAFVHYEGVGAEAWEEIQPEGNIEILRVENGWAWVIPLHGRRLSVGVVSRTGRMEPRDVFELVGSSPMLRRWTRGARSSEPRLIGDYSFLNERSHGERFVAVGDAACFLDPVFSSGVTVALIGARHVAETLSPALSSGSEADPQLMAAVSAHLIPAYRAFFSLIHRWYHTAIMENLFFAQAPEPRYRAGLITMLAGDVWRADNPFQNLVTASARHAVAAGL